MASTLSNAPRSVVSTGLFVGISKFRSDQDIADIPYAVDDAVDLAHVFSMEAQFVNKVVLVIGKEIPKKPESQRKLESLLSNGATLQRPDYMNLGDLLDNLGRESEPQSNLLVAFSTHGFIDSSDKLLCCDSRRSNLDGTCLLVNDLIIRINTRCRARNKLVLIDACRELLDPPARAAIATRRHGVSQGIEEMIRKNHASAILNSTVAGGLSYDDDKLRNGVFSRFVIEGLRGDAELNEDGFITPETLAKHVNAAVAEWVRKNRPTHAEFSYGISYNSDGVAKDMRLHKPTRGNIDPKLRGLCVYLHGVSPNADQNKRALRIRNELVKPACRQSQFHFEEKPRMLLEPAISHLLYADQVIVYIGAADFQSDELAKFGFRLASGKPIIVLHDAFTPLPRTVRTILNARDIPCKPLPDKYDVQDTLDWIVDRLTLDSVRTHGFQDALPIGFIETITFNNDDQGLIGVPRYISTNKLFSQLLLKDSESQYLSGVNSEAIMDYFRSRIPEEQWKYIEMQQMSMAQAMRTETGVRRETEAAPLAQYPIVYQNQDSPGDVQAFLPVISRRTLHDVHGFATLAEIMYLDVTDWISRYPDGHYEMRPAAGREAFRDIHRHIERIHYALQPHGEIDFRNCFADANVAMQMILDAMPERDLDNNRLPKDWRARDAEATDAQLLGQTCLAPDVDVRHITAATHKYGNLEFDLAQIAMVDLFKAERSGHMVTLSPTNTESEGWRKFVCDWKNKVEEELVWELYACSYDRVVGRLSYHKNAVDQHLSALKTCRKVLDVGSGTGNLVLALAGLKIKVTAADKSRAMQSQLRAKITSSLDQFVTLRTMPVERLLTSKKRELYDGMSFMMTLWSMQDAMNVLKLGVACLKSNAILVITEPNEQMSSCYDKFAEQALAEIDAMRPTSDLKNHIENVRLCGARLAARNPGNPSLDQMLRYLKTEEGFEELRREEAYYGYATTVVLRAPRDADNRF